ncbi:protein PLANT CADMIUM RESISTANCE 4-like [Bidens hawaiensis]|uniref:protein PLANT CADMIUM RESISTANCE 4-like n=1 Tax=Bidens hawaiensis TaxID=980011 RepID=UPI00404A1570
MGRLDSSDQSPMEPNDQNANHPRSYVPQSPQNMPPPEAYPPQKPETYPPPQPEPVQFPPQPQPVPVQFPPQPPPVQFPPQQPPINAQTYSYAHANAQPQVNYGGYQTPVRTEGIAIGSQYLAPTQPWGTNNGLFDCAEDPENAIITACFPCITFGQIAEIVDNGQTSCTTSGLIYCLIASFIGIPCIMSCSYRTKIRSRYGLMETPAPDWITHCLCEWCALCQEYRELKNRGLDPAIGWQGNMIKNQQMQQFPTMTPPMNQTMM